MPCFVRNYVRQVILESFTRAPRVLSVCLSPVLSVVRIQLKKKRRPTFAVVEIVSLTLAAKETRAKFYLPQREIETLELWDVL
jgi:hypothetical protein